jgi:hypothetical protein
MYRFSYVSAMHNPSLEIGTERAMGIGHAQGMAFYAFSGIIKISNADYSECFYIILRTRVIPHLRNSILGRHEDDIFGQYQAFEMKDCF